MTGFNAVERCAFPRGCGKKKLHRACSWQAELLPGDALLIPEGWWHHVLTRGEADGAAGAEIGLAVNLWWRGYPREPPVARVYALRRLLSEMLACRTAGHLLKRKGAQRGRENLEENVVAKLLAAAKASKSPHHKTWKRALQLRGSSLPFDLGSAADAAAQSTRAAKQLRSLLDGLDGAQVALLLASLDSHMAAEQGGQEAAAALRRLWRFYPQQDIVSRWAAHLKSLAEGLLQQHCGIGPASETT